MNHQHPLHKGFKLGQFQLACGVAQGFAGARVGFKEQPIDAGSYRRAGKGFEVLTGAAGGVGGGDTIFSDGVGGIKDDGVPGLFHFVESPWVDDEVVIAEGVAAFCEDNAVVARGFNFGGDFRHVFGGEELAVLEVDDSACSSGLNHQGRLHAEVGGNLENVHHIGHRGYMVGIMNIREERKTKLLLDFLKNFQAFVHAGPHVIVHTAAVVLLEARLIDDAGEGKGLLDFCEFFGHAEHGVTRFNHAWATDEKELVATEGDVSGLEGGVGHEVKLGNPREWRGCLIALSDVGYFRA